MEAHVLMESVYVPKGLKVPDVAWTCVWNIPVIMVASVSKENVNV